MAVATGSEGFTSVTQLVPGLAFHALVSMAGAGLIGRANRLAEKEGTAAAEVAPTASAGTTG